jgi:molybdopterin converting factor small subunit
MSSTSGVYVQLPGGMCTADGRRGFECHGATVRDLLQSVIERESCTRPRIFAPDGSLSASLFLNGHNIAHLQGLETAVHPGDQLSVLSHISGASRA